jgi:hypothetical protein
METRRSDLRRPRHEDLDIVLFAEMKQAHGALMGIDVRGVNVCPVISALLSDRPVPERLADGAR